MRHGIVLFTCDRGITPDDRYKRTVDPWVCLATAAVVTSRIRLGTAVALPVESDPVTLAKTIATLDHLSGGRVLVAAKPSPGDLATWAAAGATELLWGLPDAPAGVVEAYLDRLAGRLAI